jgi:hypothetical protein
MKKPLITIAGETREMNAEEFEQYKVDQLADQTRKAEVAVKAKAKADLLERLGITEDEAKLLLS